MPKEFSRKVDKWATDVSNRREKGFPVGRQVKLPGGSDKSPAQRAIEAVDRRELPGRMKNYIRGGVEGRRLEERKPPRRVPKMPRMLRKPKGMVET